MPVGMRQQEYGLFGMVDDSIRKARLVVHDQGDEVFPGDVLRGDDNKFIPVDSGTKCYFFDPAARDLAAHRGAVNHPGQGNVIDITRLSSDFVASFFPRRRLPDDPIAFQTQRSSDDSQNWLIRPKILISRDASSWTKSG
jgi:hypothetical protein